MVQGMQTDQLPHGLGIANRTVTVKHIMVTEQERRKALLHVTKLANPLLGTLFQLLLKPQAPQIICGLR